MPLFRVSQPTTRVLRERKVTAQPIKIKSKVEEELTEKMKRRIKK